MLVERHGVVGALLLADAAGGRAKRNAALGEDRQSHLGRFLGEGKNRARRTHFGAESAEVAVPEPEVEDGRSHPNEPVRPVGHADDGGVADASAAVAAKAAREEFRFFHASRRANRAFRKLEVFRVVCGRSGAERKKGGDARHRGRPLKDPAAADVNRRVGRMRRTVRGEVRLGIHVCHSASRIIANERGISAL